MINLKPRSFVTVTEAAVTERQGRRAPAVTVTAVARPGATAGGSPMPVSDHSKVTRNHSPARRPGSSLVKLKAEAPIEGSDSLTTWSN
jgi:hypothetical protein